MEQLQLKSWLSYFNVVITNLLGEPRFSNNVVPVSNPSLRRRRAASGFYGQHAKQLNNPTVFRVSCGSSESQVHVF